MTTIGPDIAIIPIATAAIAAIIIVRAGLNIPGIVPDIVMMVDRVVVIIAGYQAKAATIDRLIAIVKGA